jgi:hypothetical protein
MRYGFLILILFLILSGCSCGSGVDNSKDTGVDAGIVCGNGYYPSFDYQCKGNVGCREINKGLCICRCVMCENERCVGMSCGGIGCEGDGGVDDFGIEDLGISDLRDAGNDIGGEEIKDVYVDDISDIRDVSDIRDAGDGGVDDFEYVCKDPGDPVGVDFWGNLDEPIVKISDRVYEIAIISGDYVVWQEGINNSGTYANDIYYLFIKDKRVRRVPNCDMYNEIDSLQVEGSRIYWANSANACIGRKKCGVIFEFDIEKRDAPEIVSIKDEAIFPKVYKNNLIYTIVGNYGPEKLGLYYTDLLTGDTKKLSDRWDILSEYSTTLWEREIILGLEDGIYGLDIDTMEKKVHYKSDLQIVSSPYYDRYPYIAFEVYYEKDKYGHYTTDSFLLDIRDDSVVQITDDENFQFSGMFRNGIYIYFENYNPKDSDVSYGHLVVKDIKTGVKRSVPNSDNHFPRDFDGVRVISTTNIYSPVMDMKIIDLEKLGVIKDGHVVPE